MEQNKHGNKLTTITISTPRAAGLSFQNAPRELEPNTADKTPPPNLTPAQRALCDFDVSHQNDHEYMDFQLRQLYVRQAHTNEILAEVQLAAATSAAVSSNSGFMTRLLKAAVADDSPGKLSKPGGLHRQPSPRITSTPQRAPRGPGPKAMAPPGRCSRLGRPDCGGWAIRGTTPGRRRGEFPSVCCNLV